MPKRTIFLPIARSILDVTKPSQKSHTCQHRINFDQRVDFVTRTHRAGVCRASAGVLQVRECTAPDPVFSFLNMRTAHAPRYTGHNGPGPARLLRAPVQRPERQSEPHRARGRMGGPDHQATSSLRGQNCSSTNGTTLRIAPAGNMLRRQLGIRPAQAVIEF